MLIQQLVYLTTLAREGHFGRAADACFVSQPTLSSGIRRLEEELGVALVRRGRRYEGLTPEGEVLRRWAHRVLADVEGMRADMAAMRSGVVGRLRIGVIPTCLPILTALTGPLLRRHPGLDLSLQSLTSREIEQGLHESQLDAGLTYLANEPLRGVKTMRLYDERYVFLTPVGEALADRDAVTWREVAGQRLCLLTPDMQNRRIVDGIFATAGATPRPAVETNSISTLYAHVLDGVTSAVMAYTWLRLFPVPPGMRAIPLGEPDVRQPVGLVWLDHRPEPRAAQALIALAREARLGDSAGDTDAAGAP